MNTFRLNRRDKVGLTTLLFLLAAFVTINGKGNMDDYPVKAWEENYGYSENFFDNQEYQKPESSFVKTEKKEFKGFDFDPNQADAHTWIELGFSPKQADVILNYRNNFGEFRKPEDLKKIYIIDEDKFQQLLPFIKIDTEKLKWIPINSCAAQDLEEIHGIGPKLADRIVKYRNKLGGFHEPDQLYEVYGLDSSVVEEIRNYCSFDRTAIRKININQAGKDELKAHPYLPFEVVATILKERETVHIENLNFLVDKSLLTAEQNLNLLPYLDFE